MDCNTLKYLVTILTAVLRNSEAIFVVLFYVVLYDFGIRYHPMKVSFSYRVVSIELPSFESKCWLYFS